MIAKIALRLIAILLGALLFFALAELTSRVVFRHIINYDIEMWRYAREVKVSGLTPGLRFEHRPRASTRLMGVGVTTNADGLRDRDFAPDKGPGLYRIAVIGDSVTFGWGVAQEETYPKVLERELNRLNSIPGLRYEVINFGVGNYNIEDVAAMLAHKVLNYSPDLVLYGAFVNDAEPRGSDPPSLLLRQSQFCVWLWGRLDTLCRRFGFRENFSNYYRGLYASTAPGPVLVRSSLKEMASICASANIPLAVAFLPELHGDSAATEMAKAVFSEEAHENSLVFIDLTRALPAGEPWKQFWVSRSDAHPNSEACRFFSGFLADYLTTEFFPQKEIRK